MLLFFQTEIMLSIHFLCFKRSQIQSFSLVTLRELERELEKGIPAVLPLSRYFKCFPLEILRSETRIVHLKVFASEDCMFTNSGAVRVSPHAHLTPNTYTVQRID